MGNIFSIQLSCDTILTRCWDCVAGQAIYASHLEENLVDLKIALDELKDRRNDVMRKVNAAELQNLTPLDEVRGWLSRSETMINEVDALLTEGPEQMKKLCVGGCCSKNYRSTLNFSKIVAKRLHDVKDLKANGVFEAVATDVSVASVVEENLADLKIALDELKDRRNDVMRKVNVAELQNLTPLDEVRGWLSRSETVINEVDALLREGPEQIKKLCVGGYCSKNYGSTLNFSKIVAKRLHDVKDLKTNGAFEVVAIEVPPTSVVERPSDPAVGLETMYNEVWSNVEEKDVGIIGLYGVGGVGKTRLLTEINNKIGVSCGGFDLVIWVVVSKGFYIGRVQDDIAKRIGLRTEEWNDKGTKDKAVDIYGVLKKKKFVLLLDDIWKRVDLSEVGIPLPTQENGSKLIFTTRSLEVCGQMKAHKKIKVPYLTGEKAWKLFEEHVGKDILESHPNIPELAREVAKECGGLPLALITIGRAMACKKTPEEWTYAIELLRRSANFVFRDMGEEVYPLLKFSYDSLQNDMVRSCLLYCSLFPEDYQIDKKMLIDFWMVEGFMDEHNNTSQARNQGHHIIGCLIDACLLEEVDDWHIKMHDVIRDMSLWIACKCEAEKWKYFVEVGYHLTEMPEIGKWRGKRRMSLMQNEIKNLRAVPNCPDLQTLFLDNNQLKVIQNDFFQFMCGLKVLSLRENEDLRKLPVGISKLVSLEYLDLSATDIRQLPTELKALEKLKCLILESLFNTIEIPRGLICGFSKLQTLRMVGSLPRAEDKFIECLAKELQCLNHLNELTLSVTSARALDRFLTAEMLHSCIQQIDLLFFRDSKQLNISSLANIKSLNALHINDCDTLEEVRIEWEGEGRMIKAPIFAIATQPCFQSLDTVSISHCSKLRDITWLILAPNLRHFLVEYCHKMEEIINEIKLIQVAELVGTSSLFAKLKYLELENLPELKSIYWDALPFSCLKDIVVRECPMLRRLPLNSNSTKGNKISIKGEEKWWKELEWEDEDTRNAFLPCFIAR